MGRSSDLVFVYLGRRGAMARFAVELARAVGEAGDSARFIISENNERADDFSAISGVEVRPVKVFAGGVGAAVHLHRLPGIQRGIADVVRESGATWVIELMPHVWSPFLERAIRRTEARRAVILHDWRSHPGDISAIASRWLRESAVRADHVLTLSRAVATDAIRERPLLAGKTSTLFHPDFAVPSQPLTARGPLKALFLGRLLPYKGLDLFVEAAEIARSRGVDLQVGVFGAGDISPLQRRLGALGAEVVNRWTSDLEIDEVIARYDLVAATHREASQSGVVALALGAGRPVIVTPVGGLPEQVTHERTGFVATAIQGRAIAEALERFSDRSFLLSCAQSVGADAHRRSMGAFLRRVNAQFGCGRS